MTMARLQERPRSYSTLERFQDDETVRAPQALGPATTAGFDDTPEVDSASCAPEVSIHMCMGSELWLS